MTGARRAGWYRRAPDRFTRRRVSALGVVLVVALVAGGCRSGGDGDGAEGDPTSTTADVSTTAISVPLPPEIEITTTTSPERNRGRTAVSVFAAGIGAPFELVVLDSAAQNAVTRQFTGDERLAGEITGVEARVVRLDGADVGAIVALAVDPVAALSEEWRASFESGLTLGGLRPPAPIRLGLEAAVSFPVTGSDGSTVTQVLWRWDNVFVLFAGVDATLVETAATALLDLLVGPFPTTVPETTAPPEDSTSTSAPTDAGGDA